jgi:hypothetical protein
MRAVSTDGARDSSPACGKTADTAPGPRMTDACVVGDTSIVLADPQTILGIIVAVSLMVASGVAKKQLKPRGPRACPVCGLRHASARCLRL